MQSQEKVGQQLQEANEQAVSGDGNQYTYIYLCLLYKRDDGG